MLALLVDSFGCNQNIAISGHLHLLFLLTGTVFQTFTWLVLSLHSDVSSNEVFLDYSIWSSTSVALYPLILLYFLHHTSHNLIDHVIWVIYKMPAQKVEIMQNNSWPALALLVTERKMNIRAGENYLWRSSLWEICSGTPTLTLLLKCVPKFTYKWIASHSNTFSHKSIVIYGPWWGNNHLFNP